MTLQEWAAKEGRNYKTAWYWVKNDLLPDGVTAEQLPSGAIFILDSRTGPPNADAVMKHFGISNGMAGLLMSAGTERPEIFEDFPRDTEREEHFATLAEKYGVSKETVRGIIADDRLWDFKRLTGKGK